MKLSLNKLYLLKQLDFFKQPVKLRLMRSKEGGASDQSIGSFFGLALSIMIVTTLSWLFAVEIFKMNNYIGV
jgi:hypothetical protein